jgi:hypothetical protein
MLQIVLCIGIKDSTKQQNELHNPSSRNALHFSDMTENTKESLPTVCFGYKCLQNGFIFVIPLPDCSLNVPSQTVRPVQGNIGS